MSRIKQYLGRRSLNWLQDSKRKKRRKRVAAVDNSWIDLIRNNYLISKFFGFL